MRDQRSEVRGRRTEDRFGQMAKEALRCHLASPSLGQYASLSFIVEGRGQWSEDRK